MQELTNFLRFSNRSNFDKNMATFLSYLATFSLKILQVAIKIVYYCKNLCFSQVEFFNEKVATFLSEYCHFLTTFGHIPTIFLSHKKVARKIVYYCKNLASYATWVLRSINTWAQIEMVLIGRAQVQPKRTAVQSETLRRYLRSTGE